MYFLESISGKDNSIWKYLAVFILTFIIMQLAGGLLIALAPVLHLSGIEGEFTPEMFSDIRNLYEAGASWDFVLVLMLFPFAAGLFAVWLLVGRIHKRTFSMTVNGREYIRGKRIFAGFTVWFVLMLVFFVTNYIVDPENFVMQFDSGKFITLLVTVLLFIPLQTTFEEFIFRGYMAQGIAAWTKNRWLAICIPGILFGLMHCQNTEVSEHGFWVTMPQYIIFGLFFGLIAVLDDGIELPIGIHAANNIFVCLFITNDSSSLQTPAIFKQTAIYHIPETVGLLAAVSLAILFLSRKYKWNFHVLNRKIE
jgi:membrane protease YdiL (CAAX protease family)